MKLERVVPTSQLLQLGLREGESEEESMDSSPDLDELVQNVDHHYRQLLRDTTLQGRRSMKWPGVHVEGRQHVL